MAATTLDAIALLKADHRKVEDLFDKFERATKAEKKQELATQICTALVVHTIIEEELFYPACKGNVEADSLDEAYVEHDGAKVLIAELQAAGPDAPFYDAKVKVLSELIKHHVHEEEMRSEGLFAQARGAEVEMVELGARMQSRQQELMARFKTEGLPPPETRSFTGHDLKQGMPALAAS